MDGDGCTGILVTHDDGRVECLDPVCGDPDAVRHDWRQPCDDPNCADSSVLEDEKPAQFEAA